MKKFIAVAILLASISSEYATAKGTTVKKINGDTFITTNEGVIKISGKQPSESGVKGENGAKGEKGDKGDKGDTGPAGPAGIAVIEPTPCIQSDLEGSWIVYVGSYKMPLEIDNAGNAMIDDVTSGGESLSASYTGTVMLDETDANECVIKINLSTDVGTDFFQEITGDGVISPEKQMIIGGVLDYQVTATKVIKRAAPQG